jgi:hypothetical protein
MVMCFGHLRVVVQQPLLMIFQEASGHALQ